MKPRLGCLPQAHRSNSCATPTTADSTLLRYTRRPGPVPQPDQRNPVGLFMRRRSPDTRFILLMATALIVAGCRTPFKVEPDEYGPTTDPPSCTASTPSNSRTRRSPRPPSLNPQLASA